MNKNELITKKKPYNIKINNNKKERKIPLNRDIKFTEEQKFRRYLSYVEPKLLDKITIDEDGELVLALKKAFNLPIEKKSNLITDNITTTGYSGNGGGNGGENGGENDGNKRFKLELDDNDINTVEQVLEMNTPQGKKYRKLTEQEKEYYKQHTNAYDLDNAELLQSIRKSYAREQILKYSNDLSPYRPVINTDKTPIKSKGISSRTLDGMQVAVDLANKGKPGRPFDTSTLKNNMTSVNTSVRGYLTRKRVKEYLEEGLKTGNSEVFNSNFNTFVALKSSQKKNTERRMAKEDSVLLTPVKSLSKFFSSV